MDPMEAARYNIYWFLSLLAPALIMLVATWPRHRAVLIVGCLASLVATYGLCNLAVQEKWRVRNIIAQTAAEKDYAQADGANLVFTAFLIAPFEAVLWTTLWGFIGWQLSKRLHPRRNRNAEYPQQTQSSFPRRRESNDGP